MLKEKFVNFATKVKSGVGNAKEKVIMAGSKAMNFALENPILSILIIGLATDATKSVAKMYVTHAEDVRRRRDFFDPRTGRHNLIKRDLDPDEQAYVDERYRNDSSVTYSQIFSDMDLLK